MEEAEGGWDVKRTTKIAIGAVGTVVGALGGWAVVRHFKRRRMEAQPRMAHEQAADERRLRKDR